MPRDGLQDEFRWDELRELADEITADLPSRDNTVSQLKKDDTPRSLAGTLESPVTAAEDDQSPRPLQPRVASKPTYRFERSPPIVPAVNSSPSGMSSDRVGGLSSAPQRASDLNRVGGLSSTPRRASDLKISDHLPGSPAELSPPRRASDLKMPSSPAVASDVQANVVQQTTTVSPDGKILVVRQTTYQSTPRKATTAERTTSVNGGLVMVGEPVVSSLSRKPALTPLSVEVESGHVSSGPRSVPSTSYTSKFAASSSVERVSSPSMQATPPRNERVTYSPKIDRVPASIVASRDSRIEHRYLHAQSSDASRISGAAGRDLHAQSSDTARISGASVSPSQRDWTAFSDRSPPRVPSQNGSNFSDAIPRSPNQPSTTRFSDAIPRSPNQPSTTRFSDAIPRSPNQPSTTRFSDAIPRSPNHASTTRYAPLRSYAAPTSEAQRSPLRRDVSPSSVATKGLPAKDATSQMEAEQSLELLLAKLRAENTKPESAREKLYVNDPNNFAGFVVAVDQGFPVDHGFTVDEGGVMGWQV